MESDHHILFVELLVGSDTYRQEFNEKDTTAEAVFLVDDERVRARALCNSHGLWSESQIPSSWKSGVAGRDSISDAENG
jgi:desulfoferrodoxin (superoxide reductase-like protein)